MKTILVIMISLSSIVYAEFTKIDNIVKDSLSKLEWQDDAVGSLMQWEAAINYCEALTIDKYSDWRLPNINELNSIADRSKVNPAIVNSFENTGSYNYWSSTSYENPKNDAWFVTFNNNGGTYHTSKDSNYYVRCVRDSQ